MAWWICRVEWCAPLQGLEDTSGFNADRTISPKISGGRRVGENWVLPNNIKSQRHKYFTIQMQFSSQTANFDAKETPRGIFATKRKNTTKVSKTHTISVTGLCLCGVIG